MVLKMQEQQQQAAGQDLSEKSKIYDILSRTHGDTDMDIDYDNENEFEFDGDVNAADTDELWNSLSDKQKHQFLNSFVKRNHQVELWRPWWLADSAQMPGSTVKIQEVTIQQRNEKAPQLLDLPEYLLNSVNKRVSRTAQNPLDSKLLLFSIEIMVAYAFSCRYFNHALLESDKDEYENIMQIFETISPYMVAKITNFRSSPTEAIQMCIYNLTTYLRDNNKQHSSQFINNSTNLDIKDPIPDENPLSKTTLEYMRDQRFISTILQDSAIIISNWTSMLSALADIHRYITKFTRLNNSMPILKKIEFFSAYLQCLAGDFDLCSRNEYIVDAVLEEKQNIDTETMAFIKESSQQRQAGSPTKSVPKIEEITIVGK